MKATLDVFRAVPDLGKTGELAFLPDYGVVITPSASYARSVIEQWLKEKALTGQQLNQSFHKSWAKVKNASTIQLVIEQVIHYLSTYGLETLNLYRDDFIYVPDEKLELPEPLALRVITALPPEELTQRSLALLESGVAMKQETIMDVLDILNNLGYKFTGLEKIRNREAQVLIADLLGIFPTNGDDLFRYLCYKATGGKTLVIKSKGSEAAIASTHWQIPELNSAQITNLSRSFNRRKPLWLAMKRAHPANVSIVNRISKLSKKNHLPLPTNVLGSLTSREFSDEAIRLAAENATPFRIVQAINAIRFYMLGDTDARFYRIRSGKGWATRSDKTKDLGHLAETEQLLISILKSRVQSTKVYCPPHVNYVIPSSEKQFTGCIPKGTTIHVDPKEGQQYMLIGIHWVGSCVDLDIRSEAVDGSVGWNACYRTDDRSVMFSGDITSAPNGASEWLYFTEKIEGEHLVMLNVYGGKENTPFKLIIGHGNNVDRDYTIDPNNVLTMAQLETPQRGMTLGLISKAAKGGVDFTIIDQGSDSRSVGRADRASIVREAAIAQNRTMLRLGEIIDFVSTPEEAEINLELEKLAKDSISGLFK